MKQKIVKQINYWLGVTAIGLVLGLSLQLARAWTEPTEAPPGGDVGAPINTSNLGQSKAGGLVLNTGGAANGLLVPNGNVGIGTTSPSSILQIQADAPDLTIRRNDNANTSRILFQNSGGNYLASIYTNGNTDGHLVFKVGPNNSDPQGLPTRLGILNNGNVGIGAISPTQALDVNGVIRTRPRASATCDANAEGGIYYDSDDNHFYGCNGSAWVQLDGAAYYN